ncbi:EAL domain-containing protein [Halothiobacillus sp.]|uniref:EAL domain-containing protein n=1 Tax=Halothiobacillus sp. TaxID=1891311 RepID=UPI00262B19CF|nr:bifunctional diguanylate cyclase/phosphodiesterase [Halothiobacillus sp.]MDD4965546.1 bifunctional diguanylate cyclase/phosphodiesterase [Halothiobacillus sp.]
MNLFISSGPDDIPDLMTQVKRGLVASAIWVLVAVLTVLLFPSLGTDGFYAIWPADAFALGFVLIWGYSLLFPLAVVVTAWNLFFVGLTMVQSLVGAFALVLSLALVLMFRRYMQATISSPYGRRLLGIPLASVVMASSITVLGIWQNPAWIDDYQTVGLFWLSESIAFLALTPLVMSCLHEGCGRAFKELRAFFGARSLKSLWLVFAVVSLLVMAALRHWGNLEFNAGSLIGLVVLALAAHALPIRIARFSIAAYILIWIWFNAYINLSHGYNAAELLGDQALVFIAALLAVISTEMVQAYRLSEQSLARQLLSDPLTGLQNDMGLSRRLQAWPKDRTGAMQPMIVIGMHIPELEQIDALMGHEESNRVELRLSRILSDEGLSDYASRVRPGVFILCLTSAVMGVRGGDVAQKLKDRIEFEWKKMGAGARYLRAGFTVFNRAQTRDLGLLTSAVLAGCQLSLADRNQLVHVEDNLDSLLSHRVQELTWVQHMRAALAGDTQAGQFILFAQTIRDTRHPDVKAFEVLLRWQDPDGNVLPPSDFLPIAERYGLMTAIDAWVMRSALEQLARSPWRAEISKVSINLSGASLTDPNLINEIGLLLKSSGCRPEQICFEITETMVIADTKLARQAVLGIKELGCKISLDDFGTGLSTFSYLKRFPFDYLKIDGEFVRHITESRIDRAIVESIQAIAFEMNTITVAEFVENLDQMETLRQIGVYYHQGYGVAKPVPIAHFLIP